jgi:hypothetical protein
MKALPHVAPASSTIDASSNNPAVRDRDVEYGEVDAHAGVQRRDREVPTVAPAMMPMFVTARRYARAATRPAPVVNAAISAARAVRPQRTRLRQHPLHHTPPLFSFAWQTHQIGG